MAAQLLTGGMGDALGALHRLERLRALIAAENLDALVLIGGVDGKKAAGNGKLPPGGLASSALAGDALAWLLGGASGRGLASAPTELYEEAVLVLTAADVRLYLPRASWDAVIGHCGLWHDLRLWLPPAAAEEDCELLEEHKARSFVQMLRGVGSCGVCLRAADAGAGASSAVEGWPLVQVGTTSTSSFARPGRPALTNFKSADGWSFLLCPSHRYRPFLSSDRLLSLDH